jgi:CoA:oxalate CoA-transferase
VGPAWRIKTVAEVCESEHLKARDMIVRVSHPTARQVTVLGVPVRLHATPRAVETPPPLLGQHTDEILRAVLGMKAIAEQRGAGVI